MVKMRRKVHRSDPEGGESRMRRRYRTRVSRRNDQTNLVTHKRKVLNARRAKNRVARKSRRINRGKR